MTGLGYVILFVGDLDASVAFYRDVVGFAHRFTDAGYAEFDTGATRFALYERRRAEWLTGHPVRPGPAAEVVVTVDDVDAEADRLRALGVAVLAPPTDRPWGHRTLHVADPDGFVVEFAEEIPRRRGRGAAGGRLVVVDVANVLGARPDGWWRDRAGATARFAGLVGAAAADDPDTRWLLVVEGAARAGVAEGTDGTVTVVHADGSGDDRIVAAVGEAATGQRTATGPPPLVVTADRALRRRVLAAGAEVAGPGWCWERLDRVGG